MNEEYDIFFITMSLRLCKSVINQLTDAVVVYIVVNSPEV